MKSKYTFLSLAAEILAESEMPVKDIVIKSLLMMK